MFGNKIVKLKQEQDELKVFFTQNKLSFNLILNNENIIKYIGGQLVYLRNQILVSNLFCKKMLKMTK